MRLLLFMLCKLFGRHEKGELMGRYGHYEYALCKHCGKPVQFEIGT